MHTKKVNRIKRLRQEILTTAMANNVPVTGDLWFSLIFRTEAELVKIARELHIRVKG